MSHWNYRISRERRHGVIVYGLREVYYNDDGSIQAWSSEPVEPFGETWTECGNDISLMTRAIGAPVLDLTMDPPKLRSAMEVNREDKGLVDE